MFMTPNRKITLVILGGWGAGILMCFVAAWTSIGPEGLDVTGGSTGQNTHTGMQPITVAALALAIAAVVGSIWLAARISRRSRLPRSAASDATYVGGLSVWSNNTRELPDGAARGRGERTAPSRGDDQYRTPTR